MPVHGTLPSVKPRQHGSSAYSLLELLVVVVIMIALASILLQSTAHEPNRNRGLTRCISNLKQIGTAWVMYAGDNKDRLPPAPLPEAINPVSARMSLLHAYVGENAKVLHCPADRRTEAQSFTNLTDVSVSYFAGLHEKFANFPASQSLLVNGDRNFIGGKWEGGAMSFSGASPLSWTNGLHYTSAQTAMGNILFMDGHVETLNEKALRTAIIPMGTNVQRVLVP